MIDIKNSEQAVKDAKSKTPEKPELTEETQDWRAPGSADWRAQFSYSLARGARR